MLFDWLCVIESHTFCNEIRYVPTVTKPNRVNDDWQTASLLAIANTHEVRVLPCSRLRQQSPARVMLHTNTKPTTEYG